MKAEILFISILLSSSAFSKNVDSTHQNEFDFFIQGGSAFNFREPHFTAGLVVENKNILYALYYNYYFNEKIILNTYNDIVVQTSSMNFALGYDLGVNNKLRFPILAGIGIGKGWFAVPHDSANNSTYYFESNYFNLHINGAISYQIFPHIKLKGNCSTIFNYHFVPTSNNDKRPHRIDNFYGFQIGLIFTLAHW